MFTQKTEEEQNLKDGEEDDFETDDDDGEVSEMEVENQTQKRKKVSVTDLIDMHVHYMKYMMLTLLWRFDTYISTCVAPCEFTVCKLNISSPKN